MKVIFRNYQKFDHNIINILDYSEIIKFYTRFEKSTLFKNRVLNHEFDQDKLVEYIKKKFNNYSFSKENFIYNMNIEIINTVLDCILVITETVLYNKKIYIVENILSTYL
jgi:hypothetical protein